MLKIASWNVNSIKVRLEQVLDWFINTDADILAIQETKIIDEFFPFHEFKSRNLHVNFSGQKTYNGVAIISKFPISNVITDLSTLEDPQRRIMAASVKDLRVINLYVPNGQEVGCDKYVYKLNWLSKVNEFIKDELKTYPKLLVLGDFNIAPSDYDVYDPVKWQNRILVSEPERLAFQQFLNLGLTDSLRALKPEEKIFSWWDYRAHSFRRNLGLRIDHILLSDDLAKSLKQADVDVNPRKHERPSDHAPVSVILDNI